MPNKESSTNGEGTMQFAAELDALMKKYIYDEEMKNKSTTNVSPDVISPNVSDFNIVKII